MKKYLTLLTGALLLAACSTPKYTYYFDHYNYNAKKNPSADKAVAVTEQQPAQESVLAIDESTLTASAKEDALVVAKPAPSAPVMTKEEAIAKLKSMSKEEKREMKKEVKKYVKENKKEIKEGKASNAMHGDLKLAAILGVIGIVLLIIGGEALYIIGSVALLVGLFFFIRWLINNN